MANNSEDLINFFDDVATTPQSTAKKRDNIEELQIKMLEEFLKTSKIEKKCLKTAQDEELKRFFDKYERDCKTDGVVDTKHDDPNYLDADKLDKEVPTCSLYVSLPSSLLEEELSDTNNKENTSARDRQFLSHIEVKPKVLMPKLNEDDNFNEDLIDELLIEKNIEINYRKANNAVSFKNDEPSTSFNNEKVDNSKFNVVDSLKDNTQYDDFNIKCDVDELKSTEYKEIINEIISKNKIKCYGVKEVKHSNTIADEYCKLKTKEEKDFINTLVTKYNLTYLEPVKKLDETFNKRSMLKSDLEKAGLTPGPTLYEKAIVLPKLMKRLEDRKIEKDKKVERKLILSSGYLNNQIENTKNDDKNMLPKTQKDENGTKIDKKATFSDFATDKVLEPPKLVMENCNRERLIAFETGRRFQNFIRTGNYFSD